MTTPTLPPADVIRLWNQVAEDSGDLATTLCRFSELLLSEFINQHNYVSSAYERG